MVDENKAEQTVMGPMVFHPYVEGATPNVEHDRVTANMMVHKEGFGDEPETIQCSFAQLLTTSGHDTYQRGKYKVGPEWVALDTGHVEDPGLFIIENTPTRHRVNPSVEQREDDAKKTIEIQAGDGQPFLIRPGRFFVGEVADASGLVIRCAHGETTVRLMVLNK